MTKAKRKRAYFPLNYWKDNSTHKEFFDDLAVELQIQTQFDWYKKMDANVIQDQHAGRMLQLCYRGNYSYALKCVYPQFDWYPWLFKVNCPAGFWNNVDSQKEYINWISEELGIREEQDWYHVKYSDIVNKRGGELLQQYNKSLHSTLSALFPHYNWIPWLFTSCPRRYWNLLSHHRKYFDWVADQYGLEKYEDWYHIKQEMVAKLKGVRVLTLHNSSIMQALKTVYPEYDWQPWLFQQVPDGFWTEQNMMAFVNWLSKELQIEKPEDWYGVTRSHIASRGGATLLHKTGGHLFKFLSRFFPDVDWDEDKLKSKASNRFTKTHQVLIKLLRETLPTKSKLAVIAKI